jgi:MOSC domain-containing protein YiiM
MTGWHLGRSGADPPEAAGSGPGRRGATGTPATWRETSVRIVSVNVGRPRTVVWRGRLVTTAIFKEPVTGRVRVRPLNLEGDEQADLSVHGGTDKAVYVYPAEHYTDWRRELPGLELPWGMFGENLTIEGLREDDVHVGDRLQVGTAEAVVTQPRLPCYKLGVRFGRDDIVKRFLASGRTGFYLAVGREGDVGVGDPVEVLARDPQGLTVGDMTRLYLRDKRDAKKLRRARQVAALPDGWRSQFRDQLAEAES